MVLTESRTGAARADVKLQGVGDFHRFAFTAMGSPCEVMLRTPSRAAADEFRRTVLDWLEDFEASCSRYRPDSTVSRINQAAGREWVDVNAELRELLALCDWFHWMTDGVFDPTAGPLLKLWDYHAPSARLPSAGEIAEAKAKSGWTRVERREHLVRLPEAGMALDLGGIGKEYAVDRVMRLAADRGFEDVLVNFGHDLRVHGHPPEGGPWRVGLENPRTPGRCWCGVALDAGAVCTSGDYLRFLEIDGRRYGHIIDPRTGHPVANGCLSVSVIAASCTEAGMLCTAGFILGAEEGLALIARTFGAEGCIWTEQGVFETRGFRSHVIPDYRR